MAGNKLFEALNPKIDADMARFLELQEQLNQGPSVMDQFFTAATTRRGPDGQVVSTYGQAYADEQQALLTEARQLAAELQQRQASGQRAPQAMEQTRTEQQVGQLGHALGIGFAYLASPLLAPALALPIRVIDKTIGIPTEETLRGPSLQQITTTTAEIDQLQQQATDHQYQLTQIGNGMPELIEAHEIRSMDLDDSQPTPAEKALQRHFARDVRRMRQQGLNEQQIAQRIEQLAREQNLRMGTSAFGRTSAHLHTVNSAVALRDSLKTEFSLRRTSGEGQILFHVPTRALLVAGILGNPGIIPQAIASFFVKNEAKQTGISIGLMQEQFEPQPSFIVLEGGFDPGTNILPSNTQIQWDESRFWGFVSNTRFGRWVQRLGGLDPDTEHLEVGKLILTNPQRTGDEAIIPLAVKLEKRSLRGGARAFASALTASQQAGELLKLVNGGRQTSPEEISDIALNQARQTIFEEGIRPDVVIQGAFHIGARLLQQDMAHEAIMREATLRQAREEIGERIQRANQELARARSQRAYESIQEEKERLQERLRDIDDYLARGGNPTDASGQ